MNKHLEKIILKKLLDNVNFSNSKGMVIASPSNEPPYKYHWVRDSSLVMRVLIDKYKKTLKNDYFIYIINYLENCITIQNLNTLEGLGEPKININKTPYNEPWGRPQNDGPALRGLNMIKLYYVLKDIYPNIVNNLVFPILEKDINYILSNYDKICFDLWEEIKGWHFYTRLVQLKFLKEFKKFNEIIENKFKLEYDINKIYKKLYDNCKHHIGENIIISSFNEFGEIIRYDDASILLAFCHIDFDDEYVKLFSLEKICNSSNNLLSYFREKYNKKDLLLIGRYPDDQYYNGQIWIICSLALAQFYFRCAELKKNNYFNKLGKRIVSYIVSININLDLSEQYNPLTNDMLSAEKLTWNYSEFYFTNLIMN